MSIVKLWKLSHSKKKVKVSCNRPEQAQRGSR